MFEDKAVWAYETMACFAAEEYRMPGVENAFAAGTFCERRYNDAMDAYERLRNRLGVADEDRDVECIIQAFEDIQQELCLRSYRYGAQFGMERAAEDYY